MHRCLLHFATDYDAGSEAAVVRSLQAGHDATQTGLGDAEAAGRTAASAREQIGGYVVESEIAGVWR